MQSSVLHIQTYLFTSMDVRMHTISFCSPEPAPPVSDVVLQNATCQSRDTLNNSTTLEDDEV